MFPRTLLSQEKAPSSVFPLNLSSLPVTGLEVCLMALSLAIAGRAACGRLGVRCASAILTKDLIGTSKTTGRRTLSGAVGSGPSGPDEEVVALSKISTQSIVDALWLSNYPQPYIHGARPMLPGMTCAGRAVTLRFVPHRPDIASDKPQGVIIVCSGT